MLKILSTSQRKDTDAYTIKNEPITSIDLMERAAKQCADWICSHFNQYSRFAIFAGPGNNGGDGLAIARFLYEKKYQTEVFIIKISDNFSDDFSINYKRIQSNPSIKISTISEIEQIPDLENYIIIDAIFGSGLTRKLSGFAAKIVEQINSFSNVVISIDIPSGLFGEENLKDNHTIIRANYTLTFERPYLSFFFPQNDKFVGKFIVLPIGLDKNYIDSLFSDYYYVTKNYITERLIKRKKFSHKGNYGHALLIAGSYGKIGACVLASKAALRSGIGLLTAHVPKCGNYIMQTACPEAMLSIDQQEEVVSEFHNLKNYNAIGIGPGIGTDRTTRLLIKVLVENTQIPLLIDADAINILAENKDWLKRIPENTIFTPHPKEFERLVGASETNFERNKIQIEFSKKYKVYVVLKGAHTAITCPDGTCYFNMTGNPGMATAGSGDVLTGIILSLMAQNYEFKNAVLVGVYLHGLAGDLAAKQITEDALIAGDIVQYISEAYKYLRSDI